jgi:hypothetical protein
MRPFPIFLIATFLTCSAFGQYPFEKSPKIKYKRFQNWKIKERTDEKADYSIVIPSFFAKKGSLQFQMHSLVDKDSSIITVYKNGKLLQTFIDPYFIGGVVGPAPQAAFVEDINGDGLKDLKVIVPGNACCGAYNYYLRVIYLFQRKEGTFTKISFTDLMMDYINRPERDIDGDGNLEIITQTFQNYGDHNYWVFNLYNFNGSGLVNVNQKANYPIMVQLLYRNNYKVTDKISRAKMKQFERRLPDDYGKK